MSTQINELMALLPYKKGSKNYQKCEQIIQDISNVSKDWFSSEVIHESAMRLAVRDSMVLHNRMDVAYKKPLVDSLNIMLQSRLKQLLPISNTLRL